MCIAINYAVAMNMTTSFNQEYIFHHLIISHFHSPAHQDLLLLLFEMCTDSVTLNWMNTFQK